MDSTRAGKHFEVSLDAADQAAAEEAVHSMCETLLANPVVEQFEFTVAETSSEDS